MLKKWTKTELRRLMIAYHMGANYYSLCKILDKSASSINKQLCRSGIRPLGSSKRGKKSTGGPVLIEKIWEEIYIQERLNPLKEDIKPTQLLKKPVFLKVKKNNRLSLKDDTLHYCDTLQTPISYLTTLGYQVKKVCLHWADYVINSKPLTACQLLIFANRLRCESGKKPFAVSGYSN